MKYFYTLAVMLLCSISAFAADFTTVSTTPANGENVSQVSSITLTYAEAVTVDTSKLPFIYTVDESGVETQVSGCVTEVSEDGTTVTITPIIFVGFPMPTTLTDEGNYVVHLQAGFVTSDNGSSAAEDLTFSIGTATAIYSVELQQSAQTFDLNGRQAEQMQAGQIYLRDGRKMIVR